jgi:prepilin-type processing-associated H-X9-DG protein
LATKIFRCPSWVVKSGIAAEYQSGYGWNLIYLGFKGFASLGYKEYVLQSEMRKPSETVMAGDSSDYCSNPASKPEEYTFFVIPSWGAQYTCSRHLGGLNSLWGDGHVSWLSYRDFRLGANGDSSYYFKRDK